MSVEKKKILFGAGNYGKKALAYFGHECVYGFVDNNSALAGTFIDGHPVISFEQLKRIHNNYEIVIATGTEMLFSIAAQLKEAEIHDYKVFLRILSEAQRLPDNRVTIPANDEKEKFCTKTLSKCKQVFIAAYFFPPLSGSGVFRSLKFVKYLGEFGWNATVFAADSPPLEWNYTDESLLSEIPKEVKVIRLPDRIGTMQKTSFSIAEENELLLFLENAFEESEEAKTFFLSLAQTKSEKTMLMTFPCYALLWAWDVIQFIEKNLDLSQFQIIYTTSGPYSTHLIGFYLKKKYNIPWIADYRDPWTKNAYLYNAKSKETVRFKLLSELENILLKTADRNLWVEENTAESHRRYFDLPLGKTIGITNGYDEADFANLEASKVQPEKFTITYSGMAMLPANIKGIQACFSALRQLLDEKRMDSNNICFRFVGDTKQDITELAVPYGLEGIVQQVGYCIHSKAIQANLNSNILLLVIGDEPRQKYVHASKFFEYLRSGRPILALAPTDGVVAETLRESRHGEAHLSTDLFGIKEMILREYQKWQRGEEQERLHSPLIERFERKNLTRQLASIFNEVCR